MLMHRLPATELRVPTLAHGDGALLDDAPQHLILANNPPARGEAAGTL